MIVLIVIILAVIGTVVGLVVVPNVSVFRSLSHFLFVAFITNFFKSNDDDDGDGDDN